MKTEYQQELFNRAVQLLENALLYSPHASDEVKLVRCAMALDTLKKYRMAVIKGE